MAYITTERQLSADDVRKLVDTWRDQPLVLEAGFTFHATREPQPVCVNYQASRSRPAYTPPDNFYWLSEEGPSDCSWIVPGTAN